MSSQPASPVLIRGGGDLASGVAWRLHRAGFRVAITEIPQPLAVRRLVSFAEAVYRGEFSVEGVTAVRAESTAQALDQLEAGCIPVLVDPGAGCADELQPAVIVDARMLKRYPGESLPKAELVIGLGPGFTAGVNCHAVIETNRGHSMGRVYWQGSAQPDTGVPERVALHQNERVLRAPCDGLLRGLAEIGALLKNGQPIADIAGQVVTAPFDGVLRGLLHPGLVVHAGLKIADVDPRGDPAYCTHISDKSLAVGGGLLEAVLTNPALRALLCS